MALSPTGCQGAPRKEVDVDVARRCASIGCTMEEIAAVLGVCAKTLYNRLHDEPELRQAIDFGRERMAASRSADFRGSVPMPAPTPC